MFSIVPPKPVPNLVTADAREAITVPIQSVHDYAVNRQHARRNAVPLCQQAARLIIGITSNITLRGYAEDAGGDDDADDAGGDGDDDADDAVTLPATSPCGPRQRLKGRPQWRANRGQKAEHARKCYPWPVKVTGKAAWSLAAVTTLGLLAGCGGSTNRNLADGAGGSASMTGANITGGAGIAASAGSGGTPPLRTVDSFETGDTMVSIGLWMGFEGNSLPIGTPPLPHDGSALHLMGTTDAAGLDVFFHTPLPVERIWTSVRFWTQSDQPGSSLTVAVAGPEKSYFTDRANGLLWPQRTVEPSASWQEVVVDFKDLGIDADHLSPHSGPWGAVHFIIEPNTSYDLWIDDFAGQMAYF